MAQSHRLQNSSKFALLMIALVLTFAFAPIRSSSGQSPQDNRQLQRDSSRSGPNERRTALVIGNGAYTNASPLKNPPNDATLVATTLRKLGFEVTVATNRSQREMKQLIREFGRHLQTVGGVGLFYFAGHGVQSKGHNYLIPVAAGIQTEGDLEDVGVDVNYVLNVMDDAQNALNIAILDACRNNPFARGFRSAQGGLAQVRAPTGTLIAYATAPDSVAADGGGANSPYAEELTKQLQVPGVLVETMFRRVAEQVSLRSGGRQEPWYSANVKGDFFFISARTRIEAVDAEREYWETIRGSNDPREYKDYLQAYPNGAYVGVARAKIRQIEMATKPSPRSFRNHQGIEMVYIPPGSFMMGGNSHTFEEPVHEVTITQSFYMGKYEVTQAQWQAVMGKNDSHFKGDNLPVETVSWDDAIAFVALLNAQSDGYFYRLPTEAEWKYACRAGTTTAFAFGDSLNSDQANFDGSDPEYVSGKGIYRGKTVPVGSFQSNAFGLHDMHGNVWEWCQDWYNNTYKGAPSDGSAWLTGGEQKYRVARGGSWLLKASISRSAIRYWASPNYRDMNIGFRVVAVARKADSPPTNLQPSNIDGTKTNEPVSAAKTSASPPKGFKNQHGVEMVYIPPGRFMMGSNIKENEKPVHEVRINQPFYIGKYEVTQAQWRIVMGTTLRQQRDKASFSSSDNLGEGPNHPMYYVSWEEAKEFVRRLNALDDGYFYRLPSESEWEYACRAGTIDDYSGKLESIAWYGNNAGDRYIDADSFFRNDIDNYSARLSSNRNRTHPVGTKQANDFGLYDVLGNVGEWCEDWYQPNYAGAPTDGRPWLSQGEWKSRVLRGGSWADRAAWLRPAHRSVQSSANLGGGGPADGFRIVAVSRN